MSPCNSFAKFLALLAAFAPSVAMCADVELVGIFGQKAVLVIDGGAPKTVSAGERAAAGVRLLEVGSGSAVVEVEGLQRRLKLGGGAVRIGDGDDVAAMSSLVADSRGHFFGHGSINGAPIRFLVDTGASMVSLGISDARRAGIDYRSGQQGFAQTANGRAAVWKVRLDSVRLGDVTLRGVDALIHETDLPFALLGMSFLNRMDMRREGDRLILHKRY